LFNFPFSFISTAERQSLKQAAAVALKQLEEMRQTLVVQQGMAGEILRNMTDGVLAVDCNQKIVLANPAVEKAFDVLEPDIIGKSAREALRNNAVADLIEGAAKSGRAIHRELELFMPIQGYFWVHAVPLQGMMGVVCVLSDVTELKKLEDIRSEFVANVSHELKTPLTVIRSYVETLMDGAMSDPAHNLEFLGKIEKHAANLSALIEDILELSKLEHKKELNAFIQVDLSMIIARAVETLFPKAHKKNLQIIKELGGTECFVQGIDEHIYRAVLNLLDNAINYTSSGGKISVSCEKTAEKIIVSVTDTGVGIPAEHLARIFERFYRVDKARSRELGGTGLGLAIVKHVMKVHNGTVTVESEEGKGSKFTLSFPI